MGRINSGSLLIAGFIAGYVMYVIDLALEGWFGLFGSYKIYKEWLVQENLFKGYEDIALFIGHQLNSILFGFVFAYIYQYIPGFKLLKGVLFSIGWHILVLIVAFIFGLGGAKWLSGIINMDINQHITLFILHLFWGTTLAFFYKPPEGKN